MNATPNVSAPSHDEISARARELWMEKGSPQGQDKAIWLEAEAELMARRKTASTAAAAKPGRSGLRSKKVKSTDSNTINEGALQDALDSVGNLPRSPSSINLT